MNKLQQNLILSGFYTAVFVIILIVDGTSVAI